MFKLGLDVLKSNFELLNYPYKYFIVITKSCNSKCRFCKIWTETPANELSLAEYTKLAQNSPFLKWLNISGGEPTNRDDLKDIVAAFVQYCPDLEMVNFTTNGIDTDKIINQVKVLATLPIKKFVINVSLDGPPELHEKIRGVKGNFDTAVETFKQLREFKNINSYLAFTFYGPNNDQLFNTFDAVKLKIPNLSVQDFHLNLPQNSEHFYGNQGVKTNFDEKVIATIKQFESQDGFKINALKIFEKTYRSHAINFYKTKQMPMRCSALLSSIYISEHGDIYPCTIWNKKIASLRENDFNVKAILEKEVYKNTRQQIKKDQCPTCWTPCEAFHTIAANLHKVRPF